MLNRILLNVFAIVLFAGGVASTAQSELGDSFSGQDLHVVAPTMTIYKPTDAGTGHILVFEQGFSMSIGDNHLAAESAVVWLETITAEHLGTTSFDYNAQVFLQKDVSIRRGKAARTTDISQVVVEHGQALVARFLITGQVYATAEKQLTGSIAELEELAIYQSALAVVAPIRAEARIDPEAIVPQFGKPKTVEPGEPKPEVPSEKGPYFEYPVNISPLWDPAPKIEKSQIDDKTSVATIIGRFYIWQKRDERGGLLEFQADSAVIFFDNEKFNLDKAEQTETVLASGSLQSIYLRGNIVMTEGPRTIRSDEMFYDFHRSQALVINAEMRNYDPKRQLPIYIRAAQMRQLSEKTFKAENITLTTSEFYMPQISLNASSLVLTDTTVIDQRAGKEPDKSSYDGILYDINMQLDGMTLFTWPRLRTNFERPDVPIRSAHIGNDNDFGTSVETRWHLARLLGWKEPPGMESTLGVDYFSKRGLGAGVETEYKKQNYFGHLIGYIIDDRGEDDLGRTSDRRNIEPDQELRGRLGFSHRHYLPEDWQATVELNYLSDENFFESFYRSEFNTAKKRETLLHLKRLKDNWAFSFLSKLHINDFAKETEELPTIEYHLKGASFLDHKFTFYSDTQLGRFRDRLGKDPSDPSAPQQFYTFASSRNEVDMPFMWNNVKIVPFIAGTYGYEDQDGFKKTLSGASLTGKNREDTVWLGELGVRAATVFWKQDQSVKSRFWDIDGIRHIVKPHIEAVTYKDSDRAIAMRDMVNFGLSQRWQSRRGPKNNLQSFDWMRLDLDATWLSDTADSAVGPANTYGPAKFIFNDQSIPLLIRRDAHQFGIMRDSVNADYTWRLSDTTTVLSDMNYDTRSGVVQQLNIGVARYVYPDISYYIGSRYLRPVIIDVTNNGIREAHEEGSNSFVTAATIALNQRYSIAFSQEYNFDYGKNVKSDLTILRRYHRMLYGLTLSIDESLKRNSVVFSIWPQGVRELALGSRKYVGLLGQSTED
jgi:hypothetical protein